MTPGVYECGCVRWSRSLGNHNKEPHEDFCLTLDKWLSRHLILIYLDAFNPLNSEDMNIDKMTTKKILQYVYVI